MCFVEKIVLEEGIIGFPPFHAINQALIKILINLLAFPFPMMVVIPHKVHNTHVGMLERLGQTHV